MHRAYNSYLEFRSAVAASDSLYPLMIKTVSLVRPLIWPRSRPNGRGLEQMP